VPLPEHPPLVVLPSALIGERVLLRPYRRGDGRELFEAIDGSRAHLSRYMTWPNELPAVEDCEARVRIMRAKWDLREDLPMTIRSKATGAILGGTGMHRFDWKIRSFEIGYWVRTDAERKGYVQEACRLLSALAFRRLDATHVRIQCDAKNERSAAVPRAMGFREEARLRANTLSPEGALRDTLVFGITREEFEAAAWAAPALAAVDAADHDG